MTDNTTPEAPADALPNTPEYKFAYILATLHSCHLLGDDDIVEKLLDSLDVVMADPALRDIYESEEVDEYLRRVKPILYPSDEDVLNILADEAAQAFWDNMSDEEREEMLKVINDLFSDEEEVTDPLHAFKAPELIKDGQCNSPGCLCHDEDDNEELLAETDEFVIVKIWK